MKPVDQLENNLSRLLYWITSADAKTAPILAITTSMLAVAAALVPKPANWSLGLVIYASIAVLPLLICLVALFFVTFPRTKGPEHSMIFFKGIISKARHEYVKEALRRDETDYATDLAEQCHRNAEIASAKFAALRVSMFCLLISIPPWLVFIWKLYQLRK